MVVHAALKEEEKGGDIGGGRGKKREFVEQQGNYLLRYVLCVQEG